MKVLHLTTHLNVGGITSYIQKLGAPLKTLGAEISVLSDGGECVEQFHKAGIRTFELPIKTKSELSPKLWLASNAARKILRDEKFDLLHAHTRVTQLWAASLGKSAGIPVVTTCHGFYKNRLGRRLFPSWGERVIAISQGVVEHLENDFKVAPSQIAAVNNGVDVQTIAAECATRDQSAAKEKYGFGALDPVLGIIARLVADKGHEYLVRAVGLLSESIPNIRLLIVGDGRCKKPLQALVGELKLQSHVIFCGNVEDVIQPLTAMDIFVLPATWREGFGLSIAEAMACSKPVIVTNIWSLNTLIKNQETGILIEPKRVDVLADAISGLILDPARARQIGEAGKRVVQTHFGLERMAREIYDVYRTVLAQVTPRGGS